MADKRNRKLPNAPTVSETHPPVIARSWQALFLPAKTPLAIRDRYAEAAIKAIKGPLKNRLLDEGLTPVGSTPAEPAQFIRSERQRRAEIVQRTGVRLE